MKEELARVKSITFHPQKKIVIAGLHNGKIQGWDYLYKSKVFELEEHEGPVRVVVFHHLIERFVSGGDDCLIRLWNYKTRTVESIFKGHTDYIRSLEFHKTLPWILSASDDQTVRIWNFQSKKQIACLTGHTHYVMCARFITDSLLVTVSLDQTIRVWDYSALTTKSQKTVMDMLGVPEVILKHITDGHDRGINWIAARPGTSTFATGGDDSSIRIWDASKDSLFETDTLQGHHSHVSSLYYTRKEMLISNSEDGTMKIWDTKKRKAVKTISIDNRFWCVSMDREEKVFAAGHDTGFCIYSLEREAPVYSVADKNIYIQRESEIIRVDGKTEKKVADAKTGLVSICAGIDYVVMNYGASYIMKQGDAFHRGSGNAAVYEDKLYVLCNDEVIVKDLSGRETEREKVSATAIFGCAAGVMCGRDNILFELTDKEKKIVLPAPAKSVHALDKHIVISTEKHLIITDKNLAQISVIEEVLRINSVFVHEESIFYTTPTQIKFAFAAGDFSSLLSLDEPLWIVQIDEEVFTLVNIEGAITEMEIDMVEWRFKNALERKDRKALQECIENDALLGQAPLAYLIRKEAYKEALKYVNDPEQCTELCIRIKDYGKALEHAEKTKNAELLTRVGMAALKEDADVAERAFKAGNNLNALIFLYVATNKVEKTDSLLFTCTDTSYSTLLAILAQNNEKLSDLIFLQSKTELPKVQREPLYAEENRSSLSTQSEAFSEVEDQQVSNISTAGQNNNLVFDSPNNQEELHDLEDNNNAETDSINADTHYNNTDKSDIDKEPSKELPKEPSPSKELPKRLSTLNIHSLNAYLSNAPNDFDIEIEMKKGMKYVTESKISSAMNNFLLSLHQIVKNILEEGETVENEKILMQCSIYLQGLLAERIKRKTDKDEIAISCAIFFASLPLKKSHREKALLLAVSTCYKKENKNTAVELAKELVTKYDCTDPRIVSLAASHKPMEDAFFIDTSLPFCIDIGKYYENAEQCKICKAWGSVKCKVCPCCFISDMQ